MYNVESLLLDDYDIKTLLVQSSRVYVEYRMFAQYSCAHISQPCVTEAETCPVFNNAYKLIHQLYHIINTSTGLLQCTRCMMDTSQ